REEDDEGTLEEPINTDRQDLFWEVMGESPRAKRAATAPTPQPGAMVVKAVRLPAMRLDPPQEEPLLPHPLSFGQQLAGTGQEGTERRPRATADDDGSRRESLPGTAPAELKWSCALAAMTLIGLWNTIARMAPHPFDSLRRPWDRLRGLLRWPGSRRDYAE